MKFLSSRTALLLCFMCLLAVDLAKVFPRDLQDSSLANSSSLTPIADVNTTVSRKNETVVKRAEASYPTDLLTYD